MNASTLLPNPSLLKTANALPINREAKRWLLVAKADHDPSALYLVQLILWGLDPKGGKLLQGVAKRSSLEQAATELLSYQPANALKFLLLSEDSEADESNLTVSALDSQRSPEDAAWQAVQALDRALTEHVPSHARTPSA